MPSRRSLLRATSALCVGALGGCLTDPTRHVADRPRTTDVDDRDRAGWPDDTTDGPDPTPEPTPARDDWPGPTLERGGLRVGVSARPVTDGDANRVNYVEWIERDGTLLAPQFRAAPHRPTEDDYFGYVSFAGRERVTTDAGPGVRVRRRYRSGDRTLSTTSLVRVTTDPAVVLVDLTVANDGDRAVVVDTPDHFVARGIGLGFAVLPDPGENYSLGVQTHWRSRSADVRRWRPVGFGDGLPTVCAFDSTAAVTTALFEEGSTTAAEHAMTSTTSRKVRLMAGRVRLDPGDDARWRLGIAVHDGGSDAPERGQSRLRRIRSRF